MTERAVTEVVGGILILLIMVSTISILFTYSTPVIDDVQTNIRMRNMVTQMASLHEQMFKVTSNDIPSAMDKVAISGSLQFEDSDFRICVNNSTSTLYSVNDLKRLEYSYGSRSIAIENGGVWRRDSDNHSVMIENPRIYRSGGAVNIAVIKLQGDGSAGGSYAHVKLTLNSSETWEFNDGYVIIKPDSKYGSAWKRYLEGLNADFTGDKANITFDRLVISEYVVEVDVW